MNQDFIAPLSDRDINYSKVLGTLLSRWYWVAACIILTVSMAWFYLSLIHPRYSANASLTLNEKKSDISEILSNSSDSKSTYESINLAQSATFIIQSNAFLNKAVSRLNYRYSFYTKEFSSYEELYPDSPFRIEIIRQDTANFYQRLLKISRGEKGKFNLTYPETNTEGRTYSYGDIINIPGIEFKIVSSYADPKKTYYFRFHTKESLINRAGGTLSIDAQNLNILSLTHTDVNPYFSADVLNAISNEYVVYSSHQRRANAANRLRFIDGQLDTLSKQVDSSSLQLEKFKKANKLDNLSQKVTLDIQKLAQQQSQKEIYNLERISIERLESQIAANDGRALNLNYNLEGNLGGLLGSLVSKLNDQIYDRQDKLTKYVATSDPVVEIDRKIAETKQAIASNIRQLKERNDDNQRYIDNQIAISKATLAALPSDAIDFIALQTEYNVKQKIFSSLTEEKYKSSIALSAIEPGASILYLATPSPVVVWPIAKRIYFMAMLAGLAAGVFFIFLARFLNNNIRDIGTVENLTNVPIIGLIRRAPNIGNITGQYQFEADKMPDSIFAESVRGLRNNLVYFLDKTQGKIICVSSEISEEGRSFAVSNIACALAQLEKKVIIIDADLRKPKPIIEENGLSSYLLDHNPLTRVIKNTEIKNLDIIPSGIVPQNSAELLHNFKMQELLAFLKNIYDYIIIDTSPVGIFSDSIPLIERADINLYVIKSGKSHLNSTSQLEKIQQDYKLENFFIVLNAFKKNPLYQPFYSDTNTDIYFNKYYSQYVKKYNSDPDDSMWKRFKKADA